MRLWSSGLPNWRALICISKIDYKPIGIKLSSGWVRDPMGLFEAMVAEAAPSAIMTDSSWRRGKMQFDELDRYMRLFETAHDFCVPPEIYMVARIDGRSFTRLTKEVHKFEAPFDLRFRDYMVETTRHLMDSSHQRISYCLTASIVYRF